MAVRPGTGKVVKFFRVGSEPMSTLMGEVDELSDHDLVQIAAGIEDGTLTY